jgi:hypothetical protein
MATSAYQMMMAKSVAAIYQYKWKASVQRQFISAWPLLVSTSALLAISALQSVRAACGPTMLQQSFDKYLGSPRAWSPDAAAADFSGYGASLAGGKGFQNVLVGNREMQLNFPTGVLGYQTHHTPF